VPLVTLLPWRRRRALDDTSIDPVDVAARWVPGWNRLTSDQQVHLVDEAAAFADHVRFEAARGFDLTPETRLAVSSTAALLTLGLDEGVEAYRGVTSVIVHRTAIVQRGARPVGGGLYTDSIGWLAGQAHHRGPVVIAWDSARRNARLPERGENVLVHEFAHRLDMLDGVVDGTPLLDAHPGVARWVEVCTEAYERLRSGGEIGVLRPYAATNAGEFFAVATEAFFTLPDRLREDEPALYEVLAGFYRQDPAAA
jgi:Mlc titration factor MtfA (ptsG expression regulator)